MYAKNLKSLLFHVAALLLFFGIGGACNPSSGQGVRSGGVGAGGVASGGASGYGAGGSGGAGGTVSGGGGGTMSTGGMGAAGATGAGGSSGTDGGLDGRSVDVSQTGRDGAGSCLPRSLGNWSAMSVAGAPSGFPVRDFSYDRISRVFWTGTDLAVFSPVGTVGRYDPCTDTWRSVAVPAGVALGAAVLQSQSGLYFLFTGGPQFVFHDLAAGTWRSLSTQKIPTVGQPAINLIGDKVTIWSAGTWGSPSNAGVIYTPATDQWTDMASKDAPAARVLGATAIPRMGNVVTAGDTLFVWGGQPDPSVTDATGLPGIECPSATDKQDCQFTDGALYDPATDRWTPVASKGAPKGRFNHQTFWTGSRVVVWGGSRYDLGSTGVGLQNTNLYDGGVFGPGSDTWAPMPAPVGDLAPGTYLLMVNGRLVALSPGAIYDEAANQWTTAAHGQAVDWNQCLAPVAFKDRVVINCKNQITVVDPFHADVPTLSIPVPSDAPLNAYAVWSGEQVLRWGGYRIMPLPECPGGGSHCSDNPGSITVESNEGLVWSP